MNIKYLMITLCILSLPSMQLLGVSRADKSLRAAVKNKDIAAAKQAINEGADINTKADFGSTALMDAIMFNNIGMVTLLLDNGVNVNAKDETFNGGTALIFAAANGHVEIAKLLLNKGADITAKDNSGRTVLRAAVGGGNPELVKLLLAKGAK